MTTVYNTNEVKQRNKDACYLALKYRMRILKNIECLAKIKNTYLDAPHAPEEKL